MSPDFRTPDENRRVHQAAFFERLHGEAPASVLDVGCGSGRLLELCAAAAVPAVGVERNEAKLVGPRGSGRAVLVASAHALPWPTGAFDWACMRHVAHHLAEPEAAVRELARVCRTGVVIAEPWRDPALPEQRTGRHIDEWMKRQDRRAGHVHETDIPPATLAEWLAACGAWDLSITCRLDRRLVPLDAVAREAEERLERLPPDDEDRRAWVQLVEDIASTNAGCNGTAIVVARRRG